MKISTECSCGSKKKSHHTYVKMACDDTMFEREWYVKNIHEDYFEKYIIQVMISEASKHYLLFVIKDVFHQSWSCSIQRDEIGKITNGCFKTNKGLYKFLDLAFKDGSESKVDFETESRLNANGTLEPHLRIKFIYMNEFDGEQKFEIVAVPGNIDDIKNIKKTVKGMLNKLSDLSAACESGILNVAHYRHEKRQIIQSKMYELPFQRKFEDTSLEIFLNLSMILHEDMPEGSYDQQVLIIEYGDCQVKLHSPNYKSIHVIIDNADKSAKIVKIYWDTVYGKNPKFILNPNDQDRFGPLCEGKYPISMITIHEMMPSIYMDDIVAQE